MIERTKIQMASFITDDKGNPSSTRLGLFVSIGLLGTAMIICACNKDPQSGGIATALAGLSAAAFVGGKWSQDQVTKTQIVNASPPPAPPAGMGGSE